MSALIRGNAAALFKMAEEGKGALPGGWSSAGAIASIVLLAGTSRSTGVTGRTWGQDKPNLLSCLELSDLKNLVQQNLWSVAQAVPREMYRVKRIY